MPSDYSTGRVEKLSLNQLYEESVRGKSHSVEFNLKGEDFNLVNLRLYTSNEKQDYIYLCANDRAVKSIHLAKRIPDLKAKLYDENELPFRYAGYVSSSYLDENVNPERTDFSIPLDSEQEGLFSDEVSYEALEDALLKHSKEFLSPYIQPIAKAKRDEIAHFVQTEAPQYRATIKYNPDALEDIEPGLSKEKLDIELYKLKARINTKLKEETQELITKNTDDIWDVVGFLEEYNKLIPKISEFSADQLAEYVIYRKSIISLLAKSIKLTEAGKYELEEVVHQIIFPMRTTSDEIDYDKQNLWLIDERLSYHYYLASDKPLAAAEPIESASPKEPDIVIFNKALAYAESELPFGNVVIIEFKRPMREGYKPSDNPIEQVIRYIKDIKAGYVNDREGRIIRVAETTPFYVYIICDLTPVVDSLALSYDFHLTPDQLGYFKFHTQLNAYMEIISFQKVVQDAKKRNRVLFDKLNLPAV